MSTSRTARPHEVVHTHRRSVLKHAALGFGHVALTAMAASAEHRPATTGSPTAQRAHLRPRAKRVIFLFMKGGPSHIDTFDFKPQLQRDDGRELPFKKPRVQFAKTGKLLRSPWRFRPSGQTRSRRKNSGSDSSGRRQRRDQHGRADWR